VLFGAILKHWGTIGPAELVPKRRWTYEHCLWIAKRHAIAFEMPPQHPFNPLPLLRLALVFADDGVVPFAIVERLFRFVWQDGHLPSESAAWQALLDELGVSPAQLESTELKAQLRSNGERALAAEVFGVPTTVCEGRQFWGFDATDMLTAWLEDDSLFQSDAFTRIEHLPVGVQRRRD
jgi:2-hydroxychromene-2-carboxylate isomerase